MGEKGSTVWIHRGVWVHARQGRNSPQQSLTVLPTRVFKNQPKTLTLNPKPKLPNLPRCNQEGRQGFHASLGKTKETWMPLNISRIRVRFLCNFWSKQEGTKGTYYLRDLATITVLQEGFRGRALRDMLGSTSSVF